MGFDVIDRFGSHCYSSHCPHAPVWLAIVFVAIALGISLLTHQGYRSRRGRSSIFGSLFGNDDYSLHSYREDHEMRQADEQFREAELLKGVRDEYGVLPGGAPPMNQGFGAVPPATPAASQAHAMADPGGMVDATGMDRATIATAGAAASSSAPPGWYADPELTGAMRYWSGATWSPSGTTPPGVTAPPPA